MTGSSLTSASRPIRNIQVKNNEFSACVSNFGFINCESEFQQRDLIMRSKTGSRAHDSLSEGEKMDTGLELESLKNVR